MEEHGIYIWMKVENCEMYVCSVYCQFSMPVKPMIEYMRKIMNIVRGKPLLMCLDGSAVSDACFSTYVGRSERIKK